MKIILGSASARRQKILADMGYKFEVMVAGIDEKSIRDDDPEQLTLALANAKADALLARGLGDCLLITSDLVAVFKNQIIEKPESKDEAYRILAEYDHEPVRTVCAVVVANTKTGRRAAGVDTSVVYFDRIPEENIKRFVESGMVFEHAGAFAAENPLFRPYVKRIEGSLESVMGLPIELTKRLMENVEVDPPHWERLDL